MIICDAVDERDPSGPAAIGRALYRAYNRHDAAAAGALYRPDAVHSEVARGKEVHGREDIVRGLAGFFTLFPDAHWEPLREIAGDAGVAIGYRLTGSLQAPMGPVTAHGQQLDLRGVHLVHTDRSWISATEDYWDGATFQKQMTEGSKGAH
jgi:steroid delta-isomerase-like uncharacterized protein